VGCVGSGDPATEVLEARLDDACFTDGRVIGLEHGPAECVLALGPEATGVWEQTLEGCDDGTTAWQDIHVDAELPAGSRMEVSYRVSQDVLVPVGLPWTTLGGDTVNLGATTGRFLEVRVTLQATEDGATPALFGVSVGRVCAPAE